MPGSQAQRPGPNWSEQKPGDWAVKSSLGVTKSVAQAANHHARPGDRTDLPDDPGFLMGINTPLSKDMEEKQFPSSTGFKWYEGRGNSVVLESSLRISNLVLPRQSFHREGVQHKACRHNEFCFITGVSYRETIFKIHAKEHGYPSLWLQINIKLSISNDILLIIFTGRKLLGCEILSICS